MGSEQGCLFITPVIPDANGTGIERRASAHLAALECIGPVDVLYVGGPRPAMAQTSDAPPVPCRNFWEIPCGLSRWFRSRRTPGLTAVLHAASLSRPLHVPLRPKDRASLSALDETTHRLVFCFRLRSFEFYRSVLRGRVKGTCFVDFDDIESKVTDRQLEQDRNSQGFEQRVISRLESARLAKWERKALTNCAVVSVCSTIDKDFLLGTHPRAQVLVVPNSFRSEEALAPRVSDGTTSLLFVGTMTYQPNQDGARFFVDEVLPIIQARSASAVQLAIVGKSPPAHIQALGTLPGVKVTGSVPHIAPYYAASDLVVVPIRYGGGTRIKILEALALGRAVVSTRAGAEGLDLRPGIDILIGDTPQEMAEHCIALASDDKLRSNIVASGRQRFLELYESSSVTQKLVAEVRNMLAR